MLPDLTQLAVLRYTRKGSVELCASKQRSTVITIAAKIERAKDIRVDTVRSMSPHVHAKPHTHRMFMSIVVSSEKR